MKLSEIRHGLSSIFEIKQIEGDPNIRLWNSVLCQAVLDLAAGLSADYLDAERWIANPRNYGINSFIGVCDTVGLDAERTKGILLTKKLKMVWVIDGIDYDTLREAARAHGVSASVIYKWCLGQHYNEKYEYPPREGCGREVRAYGREGS